MSTTNHDFTHKKLYDQNTIVEEGKYVLSRMISCSYIYPGAISRNTSRCRTTIVYEHEGLSIIVTGGTIEKWSESGWRTIDEYFDAGRGGAAKSFADTDEALDRLLMMFKSFILGLPIEGEHGASMPDPGPFTPGSNKKKPKLRVLSFKDKLDKEKESNTSKKEESTTPSDFDWI